MISPLRDGLLIVAGAVAGSANSIVGSGSLITFPALVWWGGLAPVPAAITNSIGLLPGSVTGAYGYRTVLPRSRRFLVLSAATALAGSGLGGVLLLTLPQRSFTAVAPGCVLAASILVVIQPWLAPVRASRRPVDCGFGQPASARGAVSRSLLVCILLASVYGGYFTAGLGIVLIGALELAGLKELQQINAVKMLLAAIINVTSAALFSVTGHLAATPVLLIGTGALCGGWIGARLAARLPTPLLRVLVGITGGATAMMFLLPR